MGETITCGGCGSFPVIFFPAVASQGLDPAGGGMLWAQPLPVTDASFCKDAIDCFF